MYSQLTTEGKFGVILIAIFGSIFSAYVVQCLWLWFLVPIVDVQPITLLQSMGLMVLVSFLTKDFYIDEPENLETYISNVLYQCLLLPGWALTVGWVIHSIM